MAGLGRAIALALVHGPGAGLVALDDLALDPRLSRSLLGTVLLLSSIGIAAPAGAQMMVSPSGGISGEGQPAPARPSACPLALSDRSWNWDGHVAASIAARRRHRSHIGTFPVPAGWITCPR